MGLNRWNDPEGHLALGARTDVGADARAGLGGVRHRTAAGWRLGRVALPDCLCHHPTFLAFGPLVVTDLAVTLFTLLSLWTFANLWQAPTASASD